jgi:archaellum biogenesis ATPase FlaH
MKEQGKLYTNCIEVIKNYMQGSTNIACNFVNQIFDNNVKKEKILMVGEVQSGKTRAITDIINRAVEKGYEYIIVLGGTTNLLNNQTLDRLEKDINQEIAGKMIKFVAPQTIQNGMINFFRTDTNTAKFFYVFCFLKGKDSLDKIVHNFMDVYNFINKKVLIIDDETDYASVNTKKNSDESRIHSIISKLYSEVFNGKLIMVTATPFANILSSPKDPLYYERLILLEKNNDYTGSDFFLKQKIYHEIAAKKTDKNS